jgi:putative two-component system response regulator
VSETILVVDDEPSNIRIIQSALEGEYTLVAATSGEDAVTVARSSAPDMILMDVLMPGMNGVEACRKILEEASGELEPAVIFVTGLDDPQNENYALSTGGVDYITKPIHPEVLRTRVRLHMNNRAYVQYLRAVIDQRTRSLEDAKTEASRLLEQTLVFPKIRREDAGD